MYAPPGVYSDTTSGEPDFPDVPPKISPKRPTFSFKALIEQPVKTLGKLAKSHDEVEEMKGMTPVQAAEADPLPSPPPVTRKKKVRVMLEGEEDPDKEGVLDLLKSPIDVISPKQDSMRIHRSSGLRDSLPRKKGNEVSDEVLIMLRKLITDSAAERKGSLMNDANRTRMEDTSRGRPRKSMMKRPPTPILPPAVRPGETNAPITREKVEVSPPQSGSLQYPLPPQRSRRRSSSSEVQSRPKHYSHDHGLNRTHYGESYHPTPAAMLIPRPGHPTIPWPEPWSAPPQVGEDRFASSRNVPKRSTSDVNVSRKWRSVKQQDIPPLSYQALRAYHIPDLSSIGQIHHPAAFDPRKALNQQKVLHHPAEKYYLASKQQSPPQSFQASQYPQSSKSSWPAPHSYQPHSASQQHPVGRGPQYQAPPFYPHPPSFPPWQPYYPAPLPAPQPNYPSASYQALSFGADSPLPEPASAPVPTSGPWSALGPLVGRSRNRASSAQDRPQTQTSAGRSEVAAQDWWTRFTGEYERGAGQSADEEGWTADRRQGEGRSTRGRASLRTYRPLESDRSA